MAAASVQKPYTKAGTDYLENLTRWLQETRLMSEAIIRLRNDYQRDGIVRFDATSWPKPQMQQLPLSEFTIKPVVLAQRMESLLKNLWATRFVFLETMWEEYLQELVQELRHQNATIFEPFCERDFMAEVVRNVLTDNIASIDEIKNEIATRFATGITRGSWEIQWKHLSRLQIGLTEKDTSLLWFSKLATYFEMRNCIIHLQGRVTLSLRKRDKFYNDKQQVEIWPPHLDFFRHQFIACLLHIEGKIEDRLKASMKKSPV